MVNTLLMATSIGKAKGHKLLGNQCAKGRAAKLLRIFEFVKAYFTEQLLPSKMKLISAYWKYHAGKGFFTHINII